MIWSNSTCIAVVYLCTVLRVFLQSLDHPRVGNAITVRREAARDSEWTFRFVHRDSGGAGTAVATGIGHGEGDSVGAYVAEGRDVRTIR